MLRGLLTGFFLFFTLHIFAAENTDSHKSSFSVPVTLDRLEAEIEAKGMHVFARIDHAAGASKVDMTLRPTTLLIFGNPKVGTLLMQESQTAGLDLPLKALAWEDAEGQVWLTLNTAEYLATRHDITGQEETIRKMTTALDALARTATTGGQ
jgi:uncharacterized protein (DUF302 family)